MGRSTKLGKNRLDKFYHLAKEQGYRSRAAFKLIQLNRKYDFLSGCRSMMDLCAAPGGWLQVASKTMPIGSTIVGIDLVPIRPIRGVQTLIGDITTQKARADLKKIAKGKQFDCVVHDGAPNVGGAWASEAYSQASLVLDSLRLATEFLKPRGWFVTKVFRSQDYNALLYAFNLLFDKVEATKPAASRNTSAEIFVVCRGYKAPAKIDPRLLDQKHLFKEVEQAAVPQGPDALLREKTKQKRHREGYEDGISTSHKHCSGVAFLVADAPLEILARHTEIRLTGPDAVVADGYDVSEELAEKVAKHKGTDFEVKELLKDLQVLGRSEFKRLLRWRLELSKALEADLKAARVRDEDESSSEEEEEEGADDGPQEPTDPEAELLKEMEALKAKIEARKRREKKKRREAKRKARVRNAQLSAADGIGADDNAPDEESLFKLETVKKGTLKKVQEAAALGDAEMEEVDADSSDDDAAVAGGSASDDSDAEEDARRYDALMEEYLEANYSAWLDRTGQAGSKAAKRRRKRLGADGELDSDDEGDLGRLQNIQGSEDDSDDGGDGLVVKFDEDRGKAKNEAAAAAAWFSQDIFDDPNLTADAAPAEPKRAGKRTDAAAADADVAVADADVAAADADMAGDEDEGEDSDEEHDAIRRMAEKGRAGGLPAQSKETDEVEEVAADPEGSDADSSDLEEFEDLDDEARAEVLALGKKMLRSKSKHTIIEAAYNRYAFHDEGLPRWFREDEASHMKPIPMVSRAEVEEAKATMQAIDARPLKKVAEAKARKRKRMHVKLEVARAKANSIANQEDVPMRTKMREIESIYAKANSSKGKKRKPTRADQYKPKGPPKDARSRADATRNKKRAVGVKAAKQRFAVRKQKG